MWRGGGSVGIGRAWRFRLDLARVQGEGESYKCMSSLDTYVPFHSLWACSA